MLGNRIEATLTRRRVALSACAAVLILGLFVVPARGATTTSPTRGYDPSACGGLTTPPSHAPITIASDADWNPANGVNSGGGTPSSPFVISCLSIQVPAPGSGVSISRTALNRAFIIKDLVITGPGAQPPGSSVGFSNGISLMGPPSSGQAAAVIQNVTASNLDYGIMTASINSLQILDNQVDSNGQAGMQDAQSPNLVMQGNSGTANSGTCIYRSAGAVGERVQVTGNSCVGNHGDGFQLFGVRGPTPTLIATGNSSLDNTGRGFFLSGGVSASGNTAQGDSNGITLFGANVVTSNVVGGLGLGQNNFNVGIDITGGTGSVVSDNDIEGNGVGIQADPANTNGGEFGYASQIFGNKIGHSTYGILFSSGIGVGNEVWDTTWTDGLQNVTDFADSNTIIDAGSAKLGSVGQPVGFDDYIARVGLANAPASVDSTFATNPAAGQTGPVAPGLAVETGISWNFGDGTPALNMTDPSMGLAPHTTATLLPAGTPQPSPVAPVSHTYSTAATYTATLTVSGLDEAGDPISFSASVPVTVS